MTEPVILRRVDPAQNMARFYRMRMQPTLFGGVTLIREWGRIGQRGTCRYDQYNTADAAKFALNVIRQSKLRRGYQ
ncbi:WGR domain-containing protein [Roseovarius indicus]|uniref:WGR domain-containing protein n=1 Tax=Roseovarius indicus TaxID=540747 RepID=UPI00405913AC